MSNLNTEFRIQITSNGHSSWSLTFDRKNYLFNYKIVKFVHQYVFPCIFALCLSIHVGPCVFIWTLYLFVYLYTHTFLCLCCCLLSGPSCFLAGNRLHVLGQRADMETTAVISGTASRAFNTPTSNTHTPVHTQWVEYGTSYGLSACACSEATPSPRCPDIIYWS